MTIAEKKARLTQALARYEELKFNPPKHRKKGYSIVTSILITKRLIEVLDTAETMTEADFQRIKSIPVYVEDWRRVKHIKDRYGLSYNELKFIASFDR